MAKIEVKLQQLQKNLNKYSLKTRKTIVSPPKTLATLKKRCGM